MKYQNQTRYSYNKHKEELKGYIPQNEAIALLGVVFNTYRRYIDSGLLERKRYERAYWVRKKDVQRLAEDLKAKAETARNLKERGLLVDLSEARFLLSLLDRATDTEKAHFQQIGRKLNTHIENLQKRGRE
jgi:hypothetical protein